MVTLKKIVSAHFYVLGFFLFFQSDWEHWLEVGKTLLETGFKCLIFLYVVNCKILQCLGCKHVNNNL